MARSSESGAYLGGISTMLMQSDTCPSCGRVHAESRLGTLIPRSRQCPLVATGSMPTMAPPKGERGLSVEFLSGAEPITPPLPTPATTGSRKPSGLAVPWPMPSHLEDYL